MNHYTLLVSPLARSAFFGDYLDTARAELAFCVGSVAANHRRVGDMDFLEVEVEEASLPRLIALSFAHGLFAGAGGELTPLALAPSWALHEDFVYGAKYRGKTNEMLTQMLINLGLSALDAGSPAGIKLLDPMCGRGTTLLWAMRYGMRSRGIEQDHSALADVRQNVKKWCKIHRQKHQFETGFIGKANKKGEGSFLDFSTADAAMRMVVGNSTEAPTLLGGEKFHLLVSDLPYGVQHFTTANTRNPIETLEACAPGWVASLRPGGAMVLAFNSYQPKRRELIAVFARHGMEALDFAAAHRMSESIVRDIVVLRKESTGE